ncbi:MAG: Glu/Leu/Phe/Val dehydrogenase [Patescibacteria group bacterium]|nr:Glu/Leu/Phe/Val dehydrogenase [Patescibacteria group bacterium]MDE1988446.1 Glu/Leu/Phe/Val dehydrogenase [Patescibacteria group bacterium]MDE2218563.1 Glu/Leu/Phe/Val dehydrogenase [Patescibacteria group bacterium]
MNEIKKDKFGPEYVIEIYDPKIGMEGFLVIDNTALGLGKGGIRMTPTVTKEEVFRLARVMTWKNSLAGIPFGGAKAGIIWRGGSDELKREFIRSFARSIKPFVPKKYIPGPDINTTEKEMMLIAEEVGNWKGATGKPADYCHKNQRTGKKMCGLPHELGSTGFGVAHATAAAVEAGGFDIKKMTAAIDGFGNVGEFAFKHLQEMGAKIVAVSGSRGGVYYKNGLDLKKLLKLKSQGKPITEYSHGEKIAHSDIFELPVDILIPASVTDVINEKNKDKIKAKIIVEGANIPMKENIENELFQKGIIIVPDFVANAGGVISSYAEYEGCDPKQMFKMVEKKLRCCAKAIMEKSLEGKINPRETAMKIAIERIERKIK